MLGLLASLAGGTAQAHARLLAAEPAPNATVPAPKRIHLRFSEEIAGSLSSFRLTDADGRPVPMRAMHAAAADALEATPDVALGPGLYTVSWTAVSTDDGHRMTGSYRFTVR